MKISIYKAPLALVPLLFFISNGREAHSQNLQVNFGVTFRNARLAPLWIADQEGYFKKQGLDVKQVNISGGTVSVASQANLGSGSKSLVMADGTTFAVTVPRVTGTASWVSVRAVSVRRASLPAASCCGPASVTAASVPGSGSHSQPTSGTAPDFTLSLYEGYDGGYGKQLTLSQLRGKVVIVNIWASWCIPCRDEAPLLEQTWRQYKDKGLVMVGVGYNDTEPEARKYMKEFNITYPNGPDLRNVISSEYHNTGVPETFFVDRDGTIVHTEIGPLTPAKMQAVLAPLMNK